MRYVVHCIYHITSVFMCIHEYTYSKFTSVLHSVSDALPFSSLRWSTFFYSLCRYCIQYRPWYSCEVVRVNCYILLLIIEVAIKIMVLELKISPLHIFFNLICIKLYIRYIVLKRKKNPQLLWMINHVWLFLMN